MQSGQPGSWESTVSPLSGVQAQPRPVERVCGNKFASSCASQNVVIEVNMALTFSGGRVPGGTGSPTSIMVELHREVAVD